jgi:hypothetical protein
MPQTVLPPRGELLFGQSSATALPQHISSSKQRPLRQPQTLPQVNVHCKRAPLFKAQESAFCYQTVQVKIEADEYLSSFILVAVPFVSKGCVVALGGEDRQPLRAALR